MGVRNELVVLNEPCTQFEANTNWLMNLDVSSLACLYTSAANITCSTQNWPYECNATAAQPACTPYHHQAYFGHYLGHYISATAMIFEATGNVSVKARGDALVFLMVQVQQAFTQAGQEGLVYPYDIRSFQNLYDKAQTAPGGDGGGNCQPVCVPFYVLHKMLAGMLDQHSRAHNEQALKVAVGMGDWVASSVEGMIAQWGLSKWQGVLDTEWGGMNEALLNLYSVTGNKAHLAAALRFNHFQWTAPLAIGLDNLDGSNGNAGGNHANTHIPEVVGSARGYELTGNLTMRSITLNFFDILTAGEGKHWNPSQPGGHSYATGGSNAAEHWFPADKLGDTLLINSPIRGYPHAGSHTQESCTTYNALKVSRHIYGWSADPKFADYYERTLLNGILGNENVPSVVPQAAEGGIARTIELEYMLPLGGGGLTKPWGMAGPEGHFPCCWGTLSETFAKLGDSIYFRSADNATLFVNLFASSNLTWDHHSVVVTQDASGFPTSSKQTTTLTIQSNLANSSAFRIALRVPWWATSEANTITCIIGGEHVAVSKTMAGSYAMLGPFPWKTGDRVSAHFPLSLRFEQLDDDRPEFGGFGTLFFGPLLLAGLSSHDSLLLANTSTAAVESVVRRVSADGEALRFVATPGAGCGNGSGIAMIPFNDVRNVNAQVAYTTYWHTQPKAYQHTTAAGEVTLSLSNADDFALLDGASIASAASAAVHHTEHAIGHRHKNHQALSDPTYSRSLGMVGDYDLVTGSHYRLPTDGHAGPLQLSSGAPHQNSSAMMAAPFVGFGHLASVSFSYNYTVGFPPQPPANTSCASATQFGGGNIHAANLSTVGEAISLCQITDRCAGFSARTSACGSTSGMTEFEFKDGWGVAHRSQSVGWSSWIVPPPPPPSALGAMVSLGFHHNLNCPTASAAAGGSNVTWLWNSARHLPCNASVGCSAIENVTVSGLNLSTSSESPTALALHFENGDHNMLLQLPLDISLTWH